VVVVGDARDAPGPSDQPDHLHGEEVLPQVAQRLAERRLLGARLGCPNGLRVAGQREGAQSSADGLAAQSSTTTLAALPARRRSSAPGSWSRRTRWVTIGSRSRRPCSSRRTAEGKTLRPTYAPSTWISS